MPEPSHELKTVAGSDESHHDSCALQAELEEKARGDAILQRVINEVPGYMYVDTSVHTGRECDPIMPSRHDAGALVCECRGWRARA